jgi:hypothetical protein
MRRICPSGARSIHSRANAGDRGKVADHGGVRREVRAVGPRVGTNDIGIDCLNPSGTDWWSACVMDPDLPICPDCSGKLKLGLSIARFIERPDIRIRRPCPCCTHRLHPPIEPPLGPTRQSGRRKKLLPRHHFHDPPPDGCPANRITPTDRGLLMARAVWTAAITTKASRPHLREIGGSEHFCTVRRGARR